MAVGVGVVVASHIQASGLVEEEMLDCLIPELVFGSLSEVVNWAELAAEREVEPLPGVLGVAVPVFEPLAEASDRFFVVLEVSLYFEDDVLLKYLDRYSPVELTAVGIGNAPDDTRRVPDSDGR